MKVVFINDPIIAPKGYGNEWELLEDFHVRIESADWQDIPATFKVPKGFYTDLDSVPRLPVVYLFMKNRARRAPIIHDWLYENKYPRDFADAVFRAALEVEEVGVVSRYLMWLGVRIGGESRYHEAGAQQPPNQYDNG